MFLVKIYNNNDRTGDPNFRISTEYRPLDNPWDSGLIDIAGINYAIDSPHGGMIRSKFGTLSLLPVVNMNDYIGVDIYYTNTTQSNKLLLFSGVGFVNTRTRTYFSYDIFTDVPTVQIDSPGINFTGGTHTLVSVFQDYCDSALWTLDASLSGSDISVDFTAQEGQLYADMLSNLCQTYAHYFVIDSVNTTIHLRSIESGVGATLPIDGFEYSPSKYSFNIPPAKVSIGESVSYGPKYYFGGTMSLPSFNSDEVLNKTLADNIKGIYTDNPYEFQIFMPLEYFVKKEFNFVTNNKLQWTEDTVLFYSVKNTFQMIIHGISFSVSKNEVTLTGHVTEVI